VPYNLLLLPFLGGFLFIHLTHFFRFGAQRLDGYRLLFQSAIAGTGLATLARILVLIAQFSALGAIAKHLWDKFSPFSYSGTSALSLLLGPALALLINIFVNRKKANDIEVRRHGNALIRLLHQAQKERRLVSITLDNRKWYVGWVAETPNLDPQELYFRILPFTSGFRDKDTLETFRTVFYKNVLEDETVDRQEFVITLALGGVASAGFFNEDVYNDYFAEGGDAEVSNALRSSTPALLPVEAEASGSGDEHSQSGREIDPRHFAVPLPKEPESVHQGKSYTRIDRNDERSPSRGQSEKQQKRADRI
jgi:hypothetical protein